MDDWIRYEEDGLYQEEVQATSLEDNLVEALDASVQESVNRAIEKAVPGTVQQALAAVLKPITKQLEKFAKRHGFPDDP